MGSFYSRWKKKTGIDAVEFAKQVETNGAGEILLTSMDRDGTKSGYDVESIKRNYKILLIFLLLLLAGWNFRSSV